MGDVDNIRREVNIRKYFMLKNMLTNKILFCTLFSVHPNRHYRDHETDGTERHRTLCYFFGDGTHNDAVQGMKSVGVTLPIFGILLIGSMLSVL